MPIWTDQPPDDAQHFTFRICRTPAVAVFQAIITCEKAIGCRTHYFNHRTVPCDGPTDCTPCREGHTWRWHGWVSAMISSTLEHTLFEFTAPTSETLKTYARHQHTLRGCGIVAKRPSARANGRVVIKTQPVDLQKWQLPDEPNVRRILCHIWGVQYIDGTDITSAHQPIEGLHLHKDNGAKYVDSIPGKANFQEPA